MQQQINTVTTLRVVIWAAALMLFTGSATAQTFLSEDELMQTMVGKTISGLSSRDNKTPWFQNIFAHKKGKRKGKINGDFDGDAYRSKWWIKDGKWCEDWGRGRACWQMEKIGDNQIQAYKDGEKISQVWTISD